MATPLCSNFLSFLFSVSLLFLCLSSLEKGYAYGGRKAIESYHLLHNHVVQVSSLLPSSVCKSSTKGPKKGASLKLVHKHGPCSQLGQEKANAPTLAQTLVQDQSRAQSIQLRVSTRDQFKDSMANLPAKAGNSLGTGNFIVTIGLGTPKSDLSLIFDTGSDLTWTQCKPCAMSKSCYNQIEPIFDPSKSTSYSNISCKSDQCAQLRSGTSAPPSCSGSTCEYLIQYGDQSYSNGWFGKERLTLTSSDVIEDFEFGCGQKNDGLFGETAGLLGLGQAEISIVSQTAQKYNRVFSYCLPSSGNTGHLTFGNGGTSSSIKFTPLSKNSRDSSFYFVELIDISVGGQKLSIPASVFSTSGTIIDSGTVITRLPPSAYSALRSAFRQQMSNYTMTQPYSLLDTCYDLSKYETVTIPKISLFFGGNVEVELDFLGIITGPSVDQLCLAFAGNSDASDVAIIGNRQQIKYDIVYDLAGGKLGFGPGGCN